MTVRSIARRQREHFLATQSDMFYLRRYQKKNTPHVSLSRTHPARDPCDPRADAREARLAKFKREQLIVEYLNRGVSIAEIAAQVGVNEKRMRAIIRDPRTGIRGLARRMPAPPAEFVAIQVSRLNEAMLVAYSAMSGMNLRAVDRVAKIVRKLDRCHGFVAAGRRRPEPRRIEAAVETTVGFGVALFCGAELALQDGETERAESAAGGASALPGSDDRPGILPQDLEKVHFAPGNFQTHALDGCHPRESGGPPAVAAELPIERQWLDLHARFRGHDMAAPQTRTEPASAPGLGGKRPENSAASL